ncbi:MAG: glycosyltransferase family 4 protein [candidate division Zixibacteria bacterium]|nr:glycosyltransferase family 4 protein [candidate division Zixibacteria bacterium]
MNKKIKILYITPSADLYGSDVCLKEMVKRLDRERFLPFVVLPYKGDLFAELSRLKGIKIEILDLAVMRRKYMHPLRFFIFVWKFFLSSLKLYQLVKKNKIDIIHSNSSMLQVGGVAAFCASKSHVWHVREITLRPKILNILLSIILSKLSTRILCITKAVKDSYISLDGFKKKAEVLYDSLDLAPYPRRINSQTLKKELGIKDGFWVVGMVARINFWKGQQVLLKAAEKVLQRSPRTVFLVVGGADERYGHDMLLEELKALVERLKIKERVIFTGFRKDVYDIISLLDIFVLPSLNPEPLGLSLIQAMASGKPVIATAQGGPLEIIDNHKTGILIPPNNPVILADALVDLLKDPQKRERMGQAGQRSVSEKFDFEKSGYMKKLEGLYYQVLKERRENV